MRSSTLDVALGVGTTPMRATVSRTRGHVVSVAYDTFPASDVLLQRRVSLWVAANWYLFALPAMVDFGNGAAYTFLTDSVFARFPGSGGPADSLMKPKALIANETRAIAAFTSATIGMGIGHNIVNAGRTGRIFRYTQLAGMAAATWGLGAGFAGSGAGGAALFYGGSAVYGVSRVWEFVDVLRPTRPAMDVAEQGRRSAGAYVRVAPSHPGNRPACRVCPGSQQKSNTEKNPPSAPTSVPIAAQRATAPGTDLRPHSPAISETSARFRSFGQVLRASVSCRRRSSVTARSVVGVATVTRESPSRSATALHSAQLLSASWHGWPKRESSARDRARAG